MSRGLFNVCMYVYVFMYIYKFTFSWEEGIYKEYYVFMMYIFSHDVQALACESYQNWQIPFTSKLWKQYLRILHEGSSENWLSHVVIATYATDKPSFFRQD